MGVKIVTMEGFEADDLLGTLARRSEAAGMEVTILSGDRDLLPACNRKGHDPSSENLRREDDDRRLSCTAGIGKISGNACTDH